MRMSTKMIEMMVVVWQKTKQRLRAACLTWELTFVFRIMQSVAQNLHRTNKVNGIETRVESEQNLDRLIVLSIRNCTHFA